MLTKEELPACPVATTGRPIIASMAAWGTQYQRLVRGESGE